MPQPSPIGQSFVSIPSVSFLPCGTGLFLTNGSTDIDLDCFFVQVEQSLNPKLKGRAVAVHQHEDIISVSYEARALGVKKHMTPAEAVVASKGEVVLVPVQTEHGSKVSYRVYREASSQIIEAVKTCTFLRTALFEKASIDEFFVDVSDPCALKVSSSADPEVDVLSTTTGINVESQTSEYSPQQIQLLHNNWPPCVIFGDGASFSVLHSLPCLTPR
eukprot:TRINITY_DN2789_c0_g1_i15.p1 TRINITY_DN2789_c0_g1~~TRINITY_DN2789_c0_g1_i15.p1  ORF type:complete len:217 (+),score=19.00 TRINITY_DN2789_c0_g1_i15:1427-2077(+)